MVKLNENYVVDKKGHRIGVFINMKTYEKIIELLEELDDIRAYDEAKKADNEALLFDDAVNEIERGRK